MNSILKCFDQRSWPVVNFRLFQDAIAAGITTVDNANRRETMIITKR